MKKATTTVLVFLALVVIYFVLSDIIVILLTSGNLYEAGFWNAFGIFPIGFLTDFIVTPESSTTTEGKKETN